MSPGYMGKILRVNLSDMTVSIEEPDGLFYRRYLGGAGLVSYFLLKEVPQGADPLGPDNRLIFAAGPITGLPIGGSARNCVGAKSPRSGGFAKSEVGGYWGSELKRTGFDAIVVQGKAEAPAYLWVHDGEAEIRDARSLWGKTTKESEEAIRAELGDARIRTAQIGPGGEKMVSFACVMNDVNRAAGRSGLGAVMGSKNLKAIACRGHGRIETADPGKLSELTKWMGQNYPRLARGYHELGTAYIMPMLSQLGNLPVRNFGDGLFEDVSKIDAQALKDSIRIGMDTCYACPVRCKTVVEVNEAGYQVDAAYGGPEYETLAAFGSNCGISDLKAIAKANEICAANSLDTISAGCTIAFAMECFENGLLSRDDTDGIELTFGNAEGMVQIVEKIAKREGIGDLLAEGSARAAQKIGRGAERFAMHVKGVEIPMHEPRLNKGMGLCYAIDPHGADHTTGMYDFAYVREGGGIQRIRTLGNMDPLPPGDLGPAKVSMAKNLHLWALFQDSVVICQFLPWNYQQVMDILSAATGWNTSIMEAIRIGERVATMARAFNLREGLTSDDDGLPKRFFSPTPRGVLKETAINEQEMQEAIRTFYQLMGWTPDKGVPTEAKLGELGISWVAESLGI